MPRIGFQELLIILAIVLVIFGPAKIPEIGRSLGKGIREFMRSTQSIRDSVVLDDEKSDENKIN